MYPILFKKLKNGLKIKPRTNELPENNVIYSFTECIFTTIMRALYYMNERQIYSIIAFPIKTG